MFYLQSNKPSRVEGLSKLFFDFLIGFVGGGIECRADEWMRRSGMWAAVAEFDRVCVVRAAVRAMNADGHGVSAAPMLDHPADSDGADQFSFICPKS